MQCQQPRLAKNQVETDIFDVVILEKLTWYDLD